MNNALENSRKKMEIRPVIATPNIILSIKGWIDEHRDISKHNDPVCNRVETNTEAMCAKYRMRCMEYHRAFSETAEPLIVTLEHLETVYQGQEASSNSEIKARASVTESRIREVKKRLELLSEDEESVLKLVNHRFKGKLNAYLKNTHLKGGDINVEE